MVMTDPLDFGLQLKIHIKTTKKSLVMLKMQTLRKIFKRLKYAKQKISKLSHFKA